MKYLICFLSLFLFSFFIPSSNYAAFSDEGCLSFFKPDPSVLGQGEISKVEFRIKEGCLLKRVSFDSLSVPFKEEKDGTLMVLVGVGLKEKPCKKKIVFHLLKDGIHIKETRYIRVKKKRYRAEYLKVKKKMVSFPPNILKRVLDDQQAIRTVCGNIRPVIFWKEGFVWPVRSKILSPFGLRRYFNGKPRSPHSGVDLRARSNTPIRSPNDGMVVLVRDCYLSGKTVVIDHGGGLFTLYAHLSRVNVKRGQMVERGQIIGLSGSSGRVTGPHLHWGVSLLGKRVDPEMLMRLLGADSNPLPKI